MPPTPPSIRYALAPLFPIRMAGVAFDVLDAAATPKAVGLARELSAQAEAVERLARAALQALRRDPTARRSRVHARVVGMRLTFRELPADTIPEVRAYAAAAAELERLRAAHRDALDTEQDAGFRALRRTALGFMPDYVLFASPAIEELVADIRPDGEWGSRATAGVRARRDRTLLMYVQRVATKNETLSAYGPLAWGRIEATARGFRPEPRTELRRLVYFERWVADAIVAAMNADPATRAEVAPRLHPHGRVEGDAFVRLDTGARVPLDGEARALLERCDGTRPAHGLGAPERLAALAEQGVVLWAVETPAFVLDRVGELRSRVQRWRGGELRKRWEPVLDALCEIPERFVRETAPAPRRQLLGRARALLAELGAAPAGAAAEGQRALYRGSNVLGEECVRAPPLVLGGDVARRLAEDAAPWFDLWRDTYAFVAHRVNERLRALHAALAGEGRPVPLPAFLRASETAKMPLQTLGVPGLSHLAFQEVRAAFREELAGRPDAHAWSLSPQECAFLRRRFEFPRFEGFSYPSADLQLAARSAEDVAAGRYRWIVAELHLGAAVLPHGVLWSCPDEETFARHLRAVAGPACDWGFPTDLVSHTMLDFAPLGGLWTYAGPRAVPEGWSVIRPADAEVVVNDDGDVRIRAGGVDRGSFARSWVLGLGFHPFVFPLGAHTPRLEVGGVVVQRESWVVGTEDLPRGPYAPGAPELVADVDRLRAARGIPRHVFVRPTEAAVRRLGTGGRDKDVKPVFVDLESHLFLDVLARWLAKHGQLDVTEMLPAPEDLLWREEGGRHTFELRTLVVPAR
jgi:hypothetical protein